MSAENDSVGKGGEGQEKEELTAKWEEMMTGWFWLRKVRFRKAASGIFKIMFSETFPETWTKNLRNDAATYYFFSVTF